MHRTRIFWNGSAQVVLIPSDLAYPAMDVDLEIERNGDELRIRPVHRSLADALRKLPEASPEYMTDGRGEQVREDREVP